MKIRRFCSHEPKRDKRVCRNQVHIRLLGIKMKQGPFFVVEIVVSDFS